MPHLVARVGDHLVVRPTYLDRPTRRAIVVGVRHPDGSPPYRVRWIDTGRESLFFPGPDTHVEGKPSDTICDTALARGHQ